RSQARGSDHQRPPRRCLLAGRPHAGSQIPVVACARPQARAGRPAEDRGQDRKRSAGRAAPGRCCRQRQEEGRRWQGRGQGRLGLVRELGISPMLSEKGRAKVNLSLRVVGRRVDGYHDLESVVAFADCADHLTLVPGSELSLETTGPLAQACGEISDNLVLKAAMLLAARVPDLKVGAFTLDKVLPVAAGIGGGSADAAAALRLLSRLNNLSLDDPRLLEVALETGADVPVCLLSHACDMTGV